MQKELLTHLFTADVDDSVTYSISGKTLRKVLGTLHKNCFVYDKEGEPNNNHEVM